MKYCIKCKNEIPDKAVFCHKCGSEQPKEMGEPSAKHVSAGALGGLIIGIAIVIAGGIIIGIGRKEEKNNLPKLTEETAVLAEIETIVLESEDGTDELVVTAAPEKVSYTLITQTRDLSSYDKVGIQSAFQSSELAQNSDGGANNAWMALDGIDKSCWQEGVPGAGVGENMQAILDRSRQVSYLTFRLGNWLEDRYYYGNNRPKTLTVTLGDYSEQITFQDDWKEFVVEVKPAVETDHISIRIDDVYYGENWDDTCITDVGVYAEKDGLGWQQIDGKWYYFETKGTPKTGWLELNGKKYFLMDDGAMKTGFLKLEEKRKSNYDNYDNWEYNCGKGYFFLDNGSMYVGEVSTDHYLGSEMGETEAQAVGGVYVESHTEIQGYMRETVVSTFFNGETDIYSKIGNVRRIVFGFYPNGDYAIRLERSYHE